MVIAILTLCFLSAMMQNKCVVKGEEEGKKKKGKEKETAVPLQRTAAEPSQLYVPGLQGISALMSDKRHNTGIPGGEPWTGRDRQDAVAGVSYRRRG